MKTVKLHYEKASIELISFCPCDIITSSGAFDAETDEFDIYW